MVVGDTDENKSSPPIVDKHVVREYGYTVVIERGLARQ